MNVMEFGLFSTNDFITDLPDIIAPEIKTPENEQNFTSVPQETEEEGIFSSLFIPDLETKQTQNKKHTKKKLVYRDPPKKNTEFRYLLERKSFRMMRKHYKDTFEEFAKPFRYKKRLKTMELAEMDELMSQYMKLEFDRPTEFQEFFKVTDLELLRKCLKEIILSDRYRKTGEKALIGLDFEPIRNLLSKYKTVHLLSFIDTIPNSFLYAHFCSTRGLQLAEAQTDVDKLRLIESMLGLLDECRARLANNI